MKNKLKKTINIITLSISLIASITATTSIPTETILYTITATDIPEEEDFDDLIIKPH